MTTPAKSINRPILVDYQFETTAIKPPEPSRVTKQRGLSGVEVAIRPESVTSPIRADGSRAPRPWDHRWCNISLGLVNRSVQFVRTGGSQVIDTQGLIPAYAGDLRVGLSQAGFEWVFSAGAFPYSVEAEARTRALNKLASGKASLGNTLGELRQTAQGVVQVVNQLMDGVTAAAAAVPALKRKAVQEILNFGKVKPKRKRESSAAARKRMQREQQVLDTWMQHQMAIKPTLMDIDEIGRALSDSLFLEKRPMRATIKAGAQGSVSGRTTAQSGFTSINTHIVDELRAQGEAKCHISAVYDIPLSGARDWNQWGMANPLSVAWELTIYSWLVDYLVDVGGWLESLTADVGTHFVEGSLSRLMKVGNIDVALVNVYNPSYGKYTILRSGPVMFNGQVGRMNRQVLSNLHPSLVPPLKKQLSLTQLANSLTVLANFVK